MKQYHKMLNKYEYNEDNVDYVTFEMWLEAHMEKNKITINNLLDFENCWNQAVESCCNYFTEEEGVDHNAFKKFSTHSGGK